VDCICGDVGGHVGDGGANENEGGGGGGGGGGSDDELDDELADICEVNPGVRPKVAVVVDGGKKLAFVKIRGVPLVPRTDDWAWLALDEDVRLLGSSSPGLMFNIAARVGSSSILVPGDMKASGGSLSAASIASICCWVGFEPCIGCVAACGGNESSVKMFGTLVFPVCCAIDG